MTMTNVRPVIESPARTPYRFGLFSVLDFTAEERAAAGMTWEGLGCGGPGLDYAQDGCIVTGGAPHTKQDLLGCDDHVLVDPFTVIAFDQSSMARDRDNLASQRATERLTLFEQHTVEEFITLEMSATSVTVSVSGATGASLKEQVGLAIGEVEHALTDLGGEGIILVRRSTIALLPSYFSTTGSVLRTKLGTAVAACGGWGANRNDVLGVPAFNAARSSIKTGEGYDTGVNDLANYAERDYAIGWDCDAVSATPATA